MTSPRAPKTIQIFTKKRVAPFLFYKFYKFMPYKPLFFHKFRRLKCGIQPLKCGIQPLKCGIQPKLSDLQV